MCRIVSRLFFIIFVSILVSNCSNIKSVKISEKIIRIDRYNSNGDFLKSYFKKFNNELNQWYPAKCFNYDGANTSLPKVVTNCEYTKIALHLIKIDKENKNTNNDAALSNNVENEINNNQEEFTTDENQKSNDENPNQGMSPLIDNEQCLGGSEDC
tara:strand:- start:917 stop:1384 length:468 start_codon:yes stop_codon:yes gene_type:complete